MRCDKCDKTDLGEISFSSLGSGITFYFCRSCENRWWVSNSGSLDLNRVLDEATVFAKA